MENILAVNRPRKDLQWGPCNCNTETSPTTAKWNHAVYIHVHICL